MEQPVQPSVSQSTVTAPPEGKKRSYTWIILLILLLIVIVGVIVIFYLSSRSARDGEINALLQKEEPSDSVDISLSQTGFTDSFDGRIINTDRWTAATYGSSARVEQESGKLIVRIPQDGDGERNSVFLSTTSVYGGDFDASVDVQLTEGGPNSETSFVFNDDDEGWPNRLGLIFEIELNGTIFVRVVSVQGNEVSNLGSDTYAGGSSLTANIVKTGDLVTFRVNGNEVGQDSNFVYDRGGRFTLHASSTGPAFPPAVSSFDNFSLRSK